MHNIIESNVYTSPIVVPNGADDHALLAEFMEAFVQGLANRTEYLRSGAIHLDVANTWTATQTFPRINTADIHCSTIETTNTVTVAGDVNIDGEFNYSSQRTYTTLINLAACSGDVFRSGTDGSVLSESGGYVVWPICLPNRAHFGNIEVIVTQATIAPIHMRLTKRVGTNWTAIPPVTPTNPDIAVGNGAISAGAQKIVVPCAGTKVFAELEEYQLIFERAANGDRVHAIRIVNWTAGNLRND